MNFGFIFIYVHFLEKEMLYSVNKNVFTAIPIQFILYLH